jgi:hypothetical protein
MTLVSGSLFAVLDADFICCTQQSTINHLLTENCLLVTGYRLLNSAFRLRSTHNLKSETDFYPPCNLSMPSNKPINSWGL